MCVCVCVCYFSEADTVVLENSKTSSPPSFFFTSNYANFFGCKLAQHTDSKHQMIREHGMNVIIIMCDLGMTLHDDKLNWDK